MFWVLKRTISLSNHSISFGSEIEKRILIVHPYIEVYSMLSPVGNIPCMNSDFVTILQSRVLELITSKFHESPNENYESQI